MGLPSQPVTLSVAQVEALSKELSTMRHDVNNYLSLMLAAVELVKFKPDTAAKMMDNLAQQPPKVTQSIAKFSGELEKILGITRP
jgi:hypothetical protein